MKGYPKYIQDQINKQLGDIKEPKQSKYRNTKMEVDGMKFDSVGEAYRYKELLLLQKAGVILHLETQVRFELQKEFFHKGKLIRSIAYIADFAYIEHGILVVEDFKGMETPVFKIKKKMFMCSYPHIDFRIVKE